MTFFNCFKTRTISSNILLNEIIRSYKKSCDYSYKYNRRILWRHFSKALKDNTQNNSTDDQTVENADDSFDANIFVEDVKNELKQLLAPSLNENANKTDSKAAFVPGVDRNSELTLEKFLEIADNLCMQHHKRHLKKIEKIILREGVWKGRTYEQIAKENSYDPGYLDDEGSELWRLLSIALGEKVCKLECKFIFEKKIRRVTQANLNQNRAQFIDCLVNSLLNPLNSYTKFAGSVDNGWKYLVQDVANKLWHTISQVQEKASSENWQAASLNLNIEPNEEIAVQVIDSVIIYCTGKGLTYYESEVIRGTWQGKTYKNIAEEVGAGEDHIRSSIGASLWRKLSGIFVLSGDETIKKSNFKSTFERYCEKIKLRFKFFGFYLKYSRTSDFSFV